MSEHEEEEPEIKPLKPKVRWVMPQRLDFITFVGKDVVAIAHDIYIVFLNVKTLTELVYVANCHERGDGVDVISGHKSNLFTFTEKVKRGRIFVVNYPHFDVIAELTDTDVNRYKGICMMECDMIAGFSGFPDYMLSIWSWRTKQRLISLPAGVVRRDQIYMSSRTHVLVCQCWGEGLTVWEIAPCYKKCLIMKRTKEEKTGWEISDPTIVGVCWSNEGQLYAIDKHANLYGVVSDGINMVSNLEWTSDLTGPNWTCICSFLNGVLIYGPDNFIRSLKKTETSWKVVWSHKCSEPQVVRRLVSNSFSDEVVMWTKTGFAYRLWGESEENVHIQLFCYKQRNITRIQLIAPDFTHVAAMGKDGGLGFYEVFSGQLVTMKFIEGNDLFFQASPIEPVVAVCGEVGQNYGLAILEFSAKGTVTKVSSMALTHQIVSKVVFSPKGRDIIAAAMSAGHIFILKLSTDYKLTLTRYAELGRGLADCFLMSVGEMMRAFSLVLFSDRYLIGERIICINADTGKDNKFAGKMQGPYARLLPLSVKDTMLAIPHMSTSYHVLKLSGEKGVTVTVKMGPIIETGHHLKQFDGFYNFGAFLTFSADGTVFVRPPDGVQEADYNIVVSHRYEHGVKQAVMDTHNQVVVHLASNQTSACVYPDGAAASLQTHAQRHALDPALFLTEHHTITIISVNDKNYLDLQEEKKVKEEAMDYKKQRIDIVKSFEIIQKKLLELLEENITEVPLHQLSLSEFNLHLENKKERLKQAEREREDIRLQTEAQIRAQDKVTQWIKKTCWDTMLTPRVKMYAIFSHYHVENYAVLPSQRDKWPQLERLTELCGVEADADADVFRPWEEPEPEPQPTREASTKSQLLTKSQVLGESATTLERATRSRRASPDTELSGSQLRTPHALAHSAAHQYVPVPPAMTPQTLAYSFLHMNYLYHIIKLNVQNMRLWFNKQFDELMVFKKREVGLVEERNSRLRFIIEELNKLSDLRGSFHHLVITIQDPQWRQEEQPQRLIKVDPEECSIEPYISPSQIVIIPPDPGPKDDFKERALIEMMDGVLEKLWHEEIKKPIPLPQCMLDKEPENFNEEDLRHVFEYEAKVRFRNEEREKYRKMLHAEYAKLTQTVNEGIVKFNMRVKEMWLTKLKVESVIGQETLHLMRLRRTNLDRVEGAEKLEGMRQEISKLEAQVETLSGELQQIQEQGEECQATYEALAQRDKYQDRTYKNHFADLSPIIVDQCYKFFRKRPKWNQRTSVIPAVLYDLAQSVLTGQRAPMMPHECVDYYRGVDQLDLISNMPAVMDEALWATMCKLRRIKIENEIRMRAVVQESAYVESAAALWARAAAARRTRLALLAEDIRLHRERTELCSRNKTIQLVLPAGQVEIITTGHMEDYDDAALIPREDIEKINNLILKVGDMKLRMMRKQMEFRKGILAREWEHAQMKMKLRHMEQELYSYQRLKIPKELQLYLKNKELGYTDEQDYMRLEKEMEASKTSINKILNQQIQRVEEVELKINAIAAQDKNLVNMIVDLNVKVSEKRIKEDPLEPIRHRRIFKNRMETLVQRSQLVREVQQNHTTVVMLQTELELLRLKTYPTLASFRTLDC